MAEGTLEHRVHRHCGGHYHRIEDQTTVRVSGMSATVPRTIFRCDRCDDEQFTVEQREAVEKAALTAIRSANGLMSPREIRGLRERLGLTHAQLGELVYGVPRGLIEGWEKGRYLQNREADAVLRSLDDRDTLERRAARAGVVLPQPRSEASEGSAGAAAGPPDADAVLVPPDAGAELAAEPSEPPPPRSDA